MKSKIIKCCKCGGPHQVLSCLKRLSVRRRLARRSAPSKSPRSPVDLT